MRILFAFVVMLGLVSCHYGWGERITGNGRIKTEGRQVSDFNSVDVSGDVAVHIKQSGTPGVSIETDENLMQYIEVFTSGSKLVIRTKEGYNLDASKDIIAHVSAPTFKNIEASGSCDIVGEGVIRGEDELSMSVSGSGNIYMEMEVNKVSTHVSGDGSVNLKGRATNFDASVSGSGDIKCFELATDNTKLDLSGNSSVEVTVNKQLDVEASGSADVQYKGNANVSKDISGSGSVKKVD
jgi:hypothetical protein